MGNALIEFCLSIKKMYIKEENILKRNSSDKVNNKVTFDIPSGQKT
jgi:hypothetical protein